MVNRIGRAMALLLVTSLATYCAQDETVEALDIGGAADCLSGDCEVEPPGFDAQCAEIAVDSTMEVFLSDDRVGVESCGAEDMEHTNDGSGYSTSTISRQEVDGVLCEIGYFGQQVNCEDVDTMVLSPSPSNENPLEAEPLCPSSEDDGFDEKHWHEAALEFPGDVDWYVIPWDDTVSLSGLAPVVHVNRGYVYGDGFEMEACVFYALANSTNVPEQRAAELSEDDCGEGSMLTDVNVNGTIVSGCCATIKDSNIDSYEQGDTGIDWGTTANRISLSPGSGLSDDDGELYLRVRQVSGGINCSIYSFAYWNR